MWYNFMRRGFLVNIHGEIFSQCLPPLYHRFPWPTSQFLHILGDPGADSGDEEKCKRTEKYMARRKVKNGEKSPWGQCLTRPVPNGRRRSGFWLVPENLCFSGNLAIFLSLIYTKMVNICFYLQNRDPSRFWLFWKFYYKNCFRMISWQSLHKQQQILLHSGNNSNSNRLSNPHKNSTVKLNHRMSLLVWLFAGQQWVPDLKRLLEYTLKDKRVHNTRGTQREYSSKTHKYSIVELILVFKR